MKDYNGWLIVENENVFIAHGNVELPCKLSTIHKVIELDNEEDYLEKINELGLVIDKLI